ncbi:MAG: nitroreductase [Pseudorhodoplanes sp.]|nr:Nitrobenzene nitroreductase [Pseudorhodoplanes sp.]MBW7949875.1 nitroreductase [Pseudorhodoplanes sp.]MCL4712252.1 nitroreductase [Pseudorhodoplanes sp.]MCQ3943361.1 nitroreductase [Alphaproteobacteria bacterium]GIK80838.1 MAG: NADH dehydrogenase [Alphaproteobacteria bacterium]
MDVREAVATRYSCRAFLPTPVPESTVREILTRAARSPSGGNMQPWRVDVLAGARLEALKALLRPRMDELPKGEGTEYPIFPKDMSDPYRQRRFSVGEQLYRSIGIPREDKPARYRQYARNFEFFGAPVGLFISIDRSLVLGQWVDLGSFIQTVMLLARDCGLHTCPQEAWATFHRTVAAFLPLPSTMMLFCGMALGHADDSAPINSWRTPREPLEAFANFSGFSA